MARSVGGLCTACAGTRHATLGLCHGIGSCSRERLIRVGKGYHAMLSKRLKAARKGRGLPGFLSGATSSCRVRQFSHAAFQRLRRFSMRGTGALPALHRRSAPPHRGRYFSMATNGALGDDPITLERRAHRVAFVMGVAWRFQSGKGDTRWASPQARQH